MQENIGRMDRIVRTVVGPGLVGLGVSLLRRRHFVAGALGVAVGAVVTQTAVTRVCPMNAALGIDTRSLDLRLRDSRTALRVETEYAAATFVAPDPENDPARLA